VSQVLAAMRRQLPAARALLAELAGLRQQAGAQPSPELRAALEHPGAGRDPAQLETLLTRFVTGLERKQPFEAVGAWTKLAPILRPGAPQRPAG
jgi:hypothetical protein